MNKQTTLIAAIGVLVVLLLLCAGSILVASAVLPDGLAGIGGQATATSQATATTAVESEATEVSEVMPPPDIIVVPTSTSLPTNTPAPTATNTPLPTDTPVPTATNTPPPVVVLPTNPPPPPAPTSTTAPPAPPPPPPADTRGVVATAFFIEEGPNFRVSQPIWFNFNVVNNAGFPVEFGALGVMPRKNGADRPDLFQASWGNEVLSVNGLEWRDHIDLPESGSYTLRLAICFDADVNACKAGGGSWATLSSEIPVTVN